MVKHVLEPRLEEFIWLWNKQYSAETPQIHKRIARWLNGIIDEGGQRALLLAFRACGKSTLLGLFCVWQLMKNANLRILILSAEQDLADKMVRHIRSIIEEHPLTQVLRPSPRREWASDRITVERPQGGRDPSILSRGIYSNITGIRADIVICDDIEVPNTVSTPQKRQDIRARLQEIEYLLVPGGTQVFAGTPHTKESLYFSMRNERNDFSLEKYRTLKIPILNNSGRSNWPQRYSMTAIRKMETRLGPISFGSQMLLKPINVNSGYFNSNSLPVYNYDLVMEERNHQIELSLNDNRLISASAYWDPAFAALEHGDRSVLAIIFTDEKGVYWLHHVEILKGVDKEDLDPARYQCRQVAEVLQRFHQPAVIVETNGLGKFLPSLLRVECQKLGYGVAIIEHHVSEAKSLRILKGLDAVIAAKQLHVSQNIIDTTPFFEELDHWSPNAGNMKDDIIDAIAGALLAEPVRLPRRYKNLTKAQWARGFSPYKANDIFNPFKEERNE